MSSAPSAASAFNYPKLPVAESRDEIVASIRQRQVTVVVGDTGSGKTTQLPKMAVEVARALKLGGVVGCTQPRRIAATGVASRVAEEVGAQVGGFVGCQVRFSDQTSEETQIKFMTDGILLAETRGDRSLKKYGVIIIDEAHERSLNIDFLLGYLKQLLARRKDLRVVISSATLDAGGFSEFFDGAPIIEVEGRTFPVDVHYQPPHRDDEPMTRQIGRAVEWINDVDKEGDILVFLPGEREIREAADLLSGLKLPRTQVLPLFARMGMSEQRMIFSPPSGVRRIVLATNVAETSLTIPRIIYVVDSGQARVSRYRPGKGVQQLQIEPVSKASARQRMGRCGRVTEGICLRLYDEEDYEQRSEFTDPEIRRSSLAGVILQMKSLGLGDIREFPFLDPPSPKAINEGRKTLWEIGALDRKTDELTSIGWKLAKIPVDPQLGRMLLAAEKEGALAEVSVIVAGLSIMDPRERPAEKRKEADKAHERWFHADSDFLSLVNLWSELMGFREGRRWKMNQLRKFCGKYFLNFRRVLEWANLHHEVLAVCRRSFKWHVPKVEIGELRSEVWDEKKRGSRSSGSSFDAVHRALLAGVPRQIGWWEKEEKAYRGAGGKLFAVFPGSGLFGANPRPEWVLGFELVETSRLWARQCAKLDPAWVEEVAPHLCRSHYYDASWDIAQGAVYAKERVVSGGLVVVDGRRLHYGRVDPAKAREIFVREGLLGDGMKSKPDFLQHIEVVRDDVHLLEVKLRRPGLWADEFVVEFFEKVIPQDVCTAKGFHSWRKGMTAEERQTLMISAEDCLTCDLESLTPEQFPDELVIGEDSYAVYYQHDPGAKDDGVTLGVHVDQLSSFPDWLPAWGVDGDLAVRVEAMIRALPKDDRVACQPVADTARDFATEWTGYEKTGPLETALAAYLAERTGRLIHASMIDSRKLPDELLTKVWVGDEDGNELAFGTDIHAIREQLSELVSERFDDAANHGWEVSGMVSWECDALPDAVDVGGGTAWPALVDEGSFVGVRVFAEQAEAEVNHRQGCSRLAALAHPDQIKWVEKKFPLSMNGKLMLPVMGRTPERNRTQLMDLAVERSLGQPLPRNADDFVVAAEKMRSGLFNAAEEVAASLEKVAANYQTVATFVEKYRGDRHYGEIADDIGEQFDWLMRPDFLRRAGARWFARYPVYFSALIERIERLESQPLMKDLQKLDQIRPLHEQWLEKAMGDDSSPRWDEIGWLLQEWRVSLFATKVQAVVKTSAKRIGKLLDE